MAFRREHCCCLAGGKLPQDHFASLQNALMASLQDLIVKKQVQTFLSGALPGFDSLAALNVLFLKRFYPQVQLVLSLPYKEMPKEWEPAQNSVFQDIWQRADEVFYCDSAYFKGCSRMRDRFLVENSAFCLCYYRHAFWEQPFLLRYAEEQKLHIVNMAQNDT